MDRNVKCLRNALKIAVIFWGVFYLVACGGHHRYCIESAYFDGASESKTLSKEAKKTPGMAD